LKHIKNNKGIGMIMMLFMTVGLAAEMVWPVIIRNFFNLLSSPGTRETIAISLFATMGWFVLIEVVQIISSRIAHYLNIFFESRIMKNIYDECFNYLHGHSYDFFNDNFSGALVKRINRMVDAFENITDRLFYDFFPMAVKLTVIVCVLFYLNPMLGGIIFVWSLLFLAINYFLSIYRLRFDIPSAEADSKVTAFLSDTITNNINIKLFSAAKKETTGFMAVTKEWVQKMRKSWIVGSNMDTVQIILMAGLEIGMLYAAIFLWEKNLITVGDFFLIQAYLLDIFHQLLRLGRIFREYFRSLANAEEMTIILNTPHEITDKKHAKPIKITSGKVEFSNVNFRYGKTGEPVIKNLSFKVTPGEKIALIGPSGGGKSTIVKLILRLYDINKGKILIDGQSISAVTQESLRKQIALVPQDPILFHRTLMENIRYGRPQASNEEVIIASKMAYCHEFISSFPKGYETFVGERGIKLSGGQRQRVAIARAILSNAKILILDEATSSLDSESETLVQNALKNLLKNKTSFIIAHRLSTIMSVDRIFVLKEGKIIETGQHADLVNKKSSLYGKLWNIQVGGFLGSNEMA